LLAGVLEPEFAAVDVPVEVDGALVVDELDEQAARPAARRPVAVSASTLLLVILLVVNFDLSFRG
jgi:hypothetical protein